MMPGEFDYLDTGGPGDFFGGGDPTFGENFPLPDPGNQTDPYEGGYLDGSGGGMGGYQSPGYTSNLDPGMWSQMLRALGLSSGGGAGGGMSSLLPLLSLLGIGAGGFMNSSATNKASDQMVQATKDANDAVTKILGGQQAAYTPYTQLGAGAAAALPGLAFKPLAGNFKPLGSGAAMAPTGGGMTLSNLMRRGR